MIQYIIVGILFLVAIFFMVYKLVSSSKKRHCGDDHCGCK
ncbi:MAG: FeoB-associated Cys-rich membrane protein [Bacteroidia bacterium]|nr:FeoB-associated Cys-rich membrane protein [Bacteroidia bacterium]